MTGTDITDHLDCGDETAPILSSPSIHKTACNTLNNTLNSLRQATVKALEFSYAGRSAEALSRIQPDN